MTKRFMGFDGVQDMEQTKVDLCRALGLKEDYVARIDIVITPYEEIQATCVVYVDKEQASRIIEIVDRADKKEV